MSTSPWTQPQPEIAPELRACEPVYLALIKTLHSASRSDEQLTSLAAADDAQYYIAGDGHPNAAGYAVVAKAIADYCPGLNCLMPP